MSYENDMGKDDGCFILMSHFMSMCSLDWKYVRLNMTFAEVFGHMDDFINSELRTFFFYSSYVMPANFGSFEK